MLGLYVDTNSYMPWKHQPVRSYEAPPVGGFMIGDGVMSDKSFLALWEFRGLKLNVGAPSGRPPLGRYKASRYSTITSRNPKDPHKVSPTTGRYPANSERTWQFPVPGCAPSTNINNFLSIVTPLVPTVPIPIRHPASTNRSLPMIYPSCPAPPHGLSYSHTIQLDVFRWRYAQRMHHLRQYEDKDHETPTHCPVPRAIFYFVCGCGRPRPRTSVHRYPTPG